MFIGSQALSRLIFIIQSLIAWSFKLAIFYNLKIKPANLVSQKTAFIYSRKFQSLPFENRCDDKK